MKIMIVDDNEENLYLLEVLLRSEKYEVVYARDGLEALEHLKKGSFGLIISDILMSRMDGYQLCRECKGDPHLKYIPFIFHTATYTDQKDEEFALSLGADKFIVKPIEPQIFLTTIREVIMEYEKGALTAKESLIKDEELYLTEYNKRLIQKLEKKMLDLAIAHKALAESEKKYRSIFENAVEGIFQTTPDGRYISINPALAGMYGYESQEEIFKTITRIQEEQYVNPEDLVRLKKLYEEKGYVEAFEVELYKKDRSRIWVSINGRAVRDEAGKILYYEGIVEDITERKRAEEALHESELRFRLAAESSTDLIYEWDIRERIDWFGKIDELLGYASGEFPRTLEAWANSVHPDDRDRVWAAVKNHLEKNEPYDIEYRIRKKDGTYNYWWARGMDVRDEKGNPYRWIGSVTDITERKKMEAALRKSEEKHRTILENIEEGYYEVDLAGNITFLNDSMCRIFGYPKEELMGMNDRQYTDKENAKRLFQAFNEVYRTGEPDIGYGYEIIRKDGTKRYIEASILLQKDSSDKPIGFRGIIRDITERKRGEEALRESEQRYRNLVENAPDVIFTLAPDGTITSLNPAFETITGWSGAEWLHKQFATMLHPNDLSRGLELFQHALKGEKTAPFELKVLRKSGDYLVAEFMVTPQTQNGSVIHILGIARDVTEREQAEEALRQSEERFRQLFDDAPVGYFEYDSRGRITSINRTELEMLGYTLAEMIGQPPWKFIVEEDIARQQILAKLAGTMPPVRGFERTYRRKDGTTFPAIVEDRLIQDSGGKIKGIRATIQDITDLKRAEEALQITQFSVEHAPESVLWIDPKGQLDYVNEGACRALGYSREELVSMSLWDIDPDFPPESWSAHWQNLPNRGPLTRESRHRAKGGKTFPVEITGDYLKYGDKEYNVAFVRDITERKRAEEEKATLQEQLRQSQKIEAIGRLAGGIAHDFNNLLTVIKGYSQLSLIELKEDVPLRGNIEEIKRASDKAADLTRQLLAFSRRQILEMRVLDLNTVLRDLDKMLHRLIGEDIELVTVFTDDLGRVKTDPGWVEQIIMNLAVNAKDAMHSGGKLTIETANVELDETYARGHIAVKPGRYVMLSVSDTGVGMTPEVKQQVFEPFFTTKEKGKGTGLGLSTVYGIVKQSGGNIWVYSEPGKGTAFKIYLPRVDEPLEEIKERVVKEELPHGSETILVVEDEEEVRKLAVRILQRQGYTVLDAPDGDGALVICGERKDPIHLILTDVVMPGISGRQLADRLGSFHPEIKVLYMSGYTDNAITHHGVLEKGMNYIQKPFTVEGLVRKVREVLD